MAASAVVAVPHSVNKMVLLAFEPFDSYVRQIVLVLPTAQDTLRDGSARLETACCCSGTWRFGE